MSTESENLFIFNYFGTDEFDNINRCIPQHDLLRIRIQALTFLISESLRHVYS